jgi:cystathionine beta-lyase/cystathionine gamma-synthase
MTDHHPATDAVRAGRPPEVSDVPVIAPVQRSVIFEFETAQRFGEVMEDASLGYLYSRIRNPSGDELAAAVAALEGAEAAHCTASGMAAINGALRLLAPPGAGVVAGTRLYGQTYAVLRTRDDVSFVDLDDEAAVATAVKGASLVYAETISNPRCDVTDLPVLARIAHESGARLMVDNTLASPVGCKPLAHGADLVVHSATKYLNGHSDAVAGIAAGSADLVARLAGDEVDNGAMLSPDSAWLVRRGLRTLHLRWERSCENALAIARFLEADDRVAGVSYPGLPSHPHHQRAQRLLNGAGGVLAFTVTGGRAAGERVMDRVELCLRSTSLGGIETLLSHPASTSHRQLSGAELEQAGIDQGMLRLSVGCEDVRDLIADLDHAL